MNAAQVERRRLTRAASFGAAAGAVTGGVLLIVLYRVLGPPDNFVPKAIAIDFIVAALGVFVGLMVASARRAGTKARKETGA